LDWLSVSDFEEVISSSDPEFNKVLGGSWTSATKPGDNFASKLLKVDIQAEMKGGYLNVIYDEQKCGYQ